MSYSASILSASSRPDSIIFLASEKYLDSCHISSCSLMIAPAGRTSNAVERNTCTTFYLRFISRLILSCTLLVRWRFQWVGGKSSYARASGSASSRIAATLGQRGSVEKVGVMGSLDPVSRIRNLSIS